MQGKYNNVLHQSIYDQRNSVSLKPLFLLRFNTETQNGRYLQADTVTSQHHISKEEIQLPIVRGIFSLIKEPVKSNLLPNIEDFQIILQIFVQFKKKVSAIKVLALISMPNSDLKFRCRYKNIVLVEHYRKRHQDSGYGSTLCSSILSIQVGGAKQTQNQR